MTENATNCEENNFKREAVYTATALHIVALASLHLEKNICVACSLRMIGKAVGELVTASTKATPPAEALKCLVQGFAEGTGGKMVLMEEEEEGTIH